MVEKILLVDRVKSSSEAQELQDMGVNIICVDLASSRDFDDARTVTRQKASSILKNVDVRSRGCTLPGNISAELDNWMEYLKRLEIKFVKFRRPFLPERKTILSLLNLGIDLVISGLEATYDTDPKWLESGFCEYSEFNPTFYQLELLADVDNSWSFLKNECPKYPTELQIADINLAAERYPLLISLDFEKENVTEIAFAFDAIRGLCFNLGRQRNGLCRMHSIEYIQLMHVLGELGHP